MPIKYKVNVLKKLKEAGHNTYRLRQDKTLGQATIQRLRDNGDIAISSLGTICRILGCQPGDIIEYVPDDPEDR